MCVCVCVCVTERVGAAQCESVRHLRDKKELAGVCDLPQSDAHAQPETVPADFCGGRMHGVALHPPREATMMSASTACMCCPRRILCICSGSGFSRDEHGARATAREAAKCRRAQHAGPAYHAWRDSAMRVLQEARRCLPTVHRTSSPPQLLSVAVLEQLALELLTSDVNSLCSENGVPSPTRLRSGLLCIAQDAATCAFGLGRGHERGRLGIDAGAGPATQG